MAREIELKLELSDEGASALETTELMPGASTSTAELHATYFDTPDHQLRRNGLSLRIRRLGEQHVQTVKADGARSVGLFTRGEWDLPLGGGTAPVADRQTPVPDLLGESFAQLVPVFEVPVLRKSWHGTFADAEIELVLDRGEVQAPGRQDDFREIELELLRGPASALFALARRIDAIAPVRLSVLSEAERGHRLLEALPSCSRAEEARIHPGMDLPEIFTTLAQSCLRQYRLNENILLASPAPEAVHQARVGLRRLRACLYVFRDLADGTSLQEIDRGLRALAATLGKARDLDVLLIQIAPGPMRDRVAAARDAAYHEVAQALASQQTRMLMLDLAEWLACGDWRKDPTMEELRRMPPGQFATEALERLFRKLRKHGRHLASLDPASRHRLRRNAKKLRYTAEFFANLFPARDAQRRHRKFIDRLQRMQDDLGTLNDMATAARILLALDGSGHAETAELLSSRNEDALLESAESGFRKLIDHKPFWR